GFAPLALRPEPSRGRWIIAIVTSVVAATVKYAGGVAALMMTAACVSRASCWCERLLRLGLVAVVGLGIVLVLWWPWLQTTGGLAPLATIRASARALLLVPLLVLTWVWSWYFSWSLALVALLGWRSGLTWIVVGYTLVVPPIVYAHQYLGDQLPAAFVLVMAL